MEKIATATYSFEKLRKAGYVYVDKTVMVRTAVVRTAAVSAAGAGQAAGTLPRQPPRRRRYGEGGGGMSVRLVKDADVK